MSCWFHRPLQSTAGVDQSTQWGLKRGCRAVQASFARPLAPLLLQAYVTSWWREIRWKHSQAGHTHIDPDVGLRGAGSGLLAEEEQVSGKQLQLWLACFALDDYLQKWGWRVSSHCNFIRRDFHQVYVTSLQGKRNVQRTTFVRQIFRPFHLFIC